MTKTGKVDNFINTIRSRLETTGFKSFVPSPRHVRRTTADLVVHFTIFCKPEKTVSGFRSDLVSCVEAVAFCSLKTRELQGLRVDIRGDNCEIGGVEVTRLAFQESQFCFGKLSLMIISLGISYILYIVSMFNFICSLTKLGTLAPRSSIFQKK